MLKNNADTIMGVILGVIISIILLLIGPILLFIGGWISGWFIKITIGGWVIKGLALLGITLSRDSLPLVCGVLGVIGSFFKTPNLNNLQKD